MANNNEPKKILWHEEEETFRKALRGIDTVKGAPPAKQQTPVDQARVRPNAAVAGSKGSQQKVAPSSDQIPEPIQTKPVRATVSTSTSEAVPKPTGKQQASGKEHDGISQSHAGGHEVVNVYSVPKHERILSSKRFFFYLTLAMVMGLAVLALSYYAPQGLLPFITPPQENEVEIDLWRLKRFPFSNLKLPPEGAVVTDAEIGISGSTQPGTEILLNGESIIVSGNGDFNVVYPLKPGANTIELTAINGDKEEYVTRQVYYLEDLTEPDEPVSTEIPESTESPEDETSTLPFGPGDGDDGTDSVTDSIEVRLTAAEGGTWIEVAVDSVVSEEVTLQAGQLKIYNVKKSITIVTSNAGDIAMAINGKDVGPLGRPNTTEERSFTYTQLEELIGEGGV